MSAFLVNPEHITEVVKWAENKNFSYAYNCITKKPIDCDPKNMVVIMAQANIDSLIARYGDTWPKEDFENYVEACLKNLKYSTDGVSQSLMTGVGECQLTENDIYNMLKCWNYQACEVENWFETDAYWLHVYMKDHVASEMAKGADITWEYNKNEWMDVA